MNLLFVQLLATALATADWCMPPCNDCWLDLADAEFQYTPTGRGLIWLHEPSIDSGRHPVVFVRQNFIRFFTSDYWPTMPFVLLSANNVANCSPFGGIPAANTNGIELLKLERLVMWFSTNVAIVHPKLTPLPLGPKHQWHSREFRSEWLNRNMVRHVFSSFDEPAIQFRENPRPCLIDLNISPNTADHPVCKPPATTPSRRGAAAHFRTFGLKCTNLSFVAPVDPKAICKDFSGTKCLQVVGYLDRLRSAKFVPSPQGNGIDTHRTWETLRSGAVPLVPWFEPMNRLYDKLPILVIKNWTDVTQAMLEQKWQKLQETAHTFDWSLLCVETWQWKIMNATIKV